jgi:hypothetical protein
METKDNVRWMDYKDVVSYNEWCAFREELWWLETFYGLSYKDALDKLRLLGIYPLEYFEVNP